MKEKPQLFSAPMVHAILADRKTQTRRKVNAKALQDMKNFSYKSPPLANHPNWEADELWVRENFSPYYTGLDDGCGPSGYFYKADFTGKPPHSNLKWKPSIHMPRVASRIQLQVLAERAERVRKAEMNRAQKSLSKYPKVWVDEAAEIPQEAIDTVREKLREKKQAPQVFQTKKSKVLRSNRLEELLKKRQEN